MAPTTLREGHSQVLVLAAITLEPLQMLVEPLPPFAGSIEATFAKNMVCHSPALTALRDTFLEVTPLINGHFRDLARHYIATVTPGTPRPYLGITIHVSTSGSITYELIARPTGG